MNSNTHNQTSDKFSLFTPSLIIPTHLVIHQLSTFSNPSTEDFEKMKSTIRTTLFPSLRPTTNLPNIANLKLLTKT